MSQLEPNQKKNAANYGSNLIEYVQEEWNIFVAQEFLRKTNMVRSVWYSDMTWWIKNVIDKIFELDVK